MVVDFYEGNFFFDLVFNISFFGFEAGVFLEICRREDIELERIVLLNFFSCGF